MIDDPPVFFGLGSQVPVRPGRGQGRYEADSVGFFGLGDAGGGFPSHGGTPWPSSIGIDWFIMVYP